MRSVYAHFPINVAVSENGGSVSIRNFLGEKYTRHVDMLPGVKIAAAQGLKDEFHLIGNDIELVSKSGTYILSYLSLKLNNKTFPYKVSFAQWSRALSVSQVNNIELSTAEVLFAKASLLGDG